MVEMVHLKEGVTYVCWPVTSSEYDPCGRSASASTYDSAREFADNVAHIDGDVIIAVSNFPLSE
jgi:hypothetical protein